MSILDDEVSPILLIMPIVPTIISFATTPQIRQTTAAHEPKPSGANIGDKNFKGLLDSFSISKLDIKDEWQIRRS